MNTEKKLASRYLRFGTYLTLVTFILAVGYFILLTWQIGIVYEFLIVLLILGISTLFCFFWNLQYSRLAGYLNVGIAIVLLFFFELRFWQDIEVHDYVLSLVGYIMEWLRFWPIYLFLLTLAVSGWSLLNGSMLLGNISKKLLVITSAAIFIAGILMPIFVSALGAIRGRDFGDNLFRFYQLFVK